MKKKKKKQQINKSTTCILRILLYVQHITKKED